jgi:hypothetical protein
MFTTTNRSCARIYRSSFVRENDIRENMPKTLFSIQSWQEGTITEYVKIRNDRWDVLYVCLYVWKSWQKMKEYLHECTLSVTYTPVGPKNPFCLFYLTELCWDYKLVFSENTLAG